MSRGIAAVATVLAACLSVPPYEPAISVSYTESGTGGTAAGPGFALHFAGGDGFHFPDALMIDGTDVMGHEAAPGCFDEDEAGIVISPTMRISAHGDAKPLMNHLVPVLRGPAVVKVRLDWATQFACEAERAPGGTATFTVFPDGRIVRYDTVVDTSSTEINSTTCTCDRGASTQFAVTAFWTFTRKLFATLYAPDHAPDPIALPGPTDPVITNEHASCIDAGGYQVAFAWHEEKDIAIHSSDAVIGFDRDLESGASTLGAFALDNRSAIFIGRAGCKPAVVRAKDYALSSCSPDPDSPIACLSINGAGMTPAKLDGIYGGDDGSGGKPGIAVGMGQTMLTGKVNSPFAVWLRFPAAVTALRATRAGAQGAWYLPQQVDDGSWIIWFRDPNSSTQVITIAPI